MNCADNLLRDHQDITTMLRVLAACAARLRQHRYVDPAMLEGLDRFLQRFVGECCFRKERTVFLPHIRAVLPDDRTQPQARSAQHKPCLVAMRQLHAVVERMRTGNVELMVDEFAAVSARCVERLTAHINVQRPLLHRVRRRQPDSDDEKLLRACAELERRYLGATGREWYAQLVSDYAEIARSWSCWPATSGAPPIDSGHSLPPRSRSRVAGS